MPRRRHWATVIELILTPDTLAPREGRRHRPAPRRYLRTVAQNRHLHVVPADPTPRGR